MKNRAINYETLEYVRSIINPFVKIVDVYVEGKWLVAVLDSNMRFKIKNNEDYKNRKVAPEPMAKAHKLSPLQGNSRMGREERVGRRP